MQSIIVVVIPCLNEEEFLLQTCRTLGFATSTAIDPDEYLCIVDNGSTDKTLEIAYEVQAACPPGKVLVGYEEEKGYVPPRHKGVMLVSQLAEKMGYSPTDTFLLQADADTQYAPGYIKAMRHALTSKEGTLVEGITDYPDDFIANYSAYIDLCNIVDSKLSSLFVDEDHDIVVDDKMAGYRLSDYISWGGLKREYLQGDEIHAETTRLYMRAKAHSHKRTRIEGAVGKHSQRKIINDPLLHFATAGFPREDSWVSNWKANYPSNFKLEGLTSNQNSSMMSSIISVRLQHLLGLFTILPVHVARTLYVDCTLTHFDQEFVGLLPHREITDLSNNPGVLIKDVFDILEAQGEQLVKKAIRSVSHREPGLGNSATSYPI